MPLSKKIFSRTINPDIASTDNTNSMVYLMQSLTQNSEEARQEFLSPEKRPDGRYVTSDATLNKWIDLRIFRETQIKRFVRWLTTVPPVLNIFFSWLFIKKMGMKVAYFSQEEDQEQNIAKHYKTGKEHGLKEYEDNFTIHNLGHATQLIQISGMNILTDPVFGDLAPLFYPVTTKRLGRNVQAEDLPPIDVILISHNHRDHVDTTSLKKLLAQAKKSDKPVQLLVPLGDEDFFKHLGFDNVQAFEWHEEITLTSHTDEQVTFCSTPADHRSGRHGHDAHQSLVTGWTISPIERSEILYFAGDTAKISDLRMTGLALDIYQLHQHKAQSIKKELPKIINMEPGGPNYTRQDMQPTHQSAVDSIISSFRLAVALHTVNTNDRKAHTKYSAYEWLHATATVFMHHNKYELGPDRFNEHLFIYARLLSYLTMSDDELQHHEQKQQAKSVHWNLFARRKDFIIDGVTELRQLAQEIWPNEANTQALNNKIIEFLHARIHFPLINEKISAADCFSTPIGQVSTIIADTYVTHKDGQCGRKGTKEAEIVIEEEVVAELHDKELHPILHTKMYCNYL